MQRKWIFGAAALLAICLVAAVAIVALDDEDASSTTTIPQATPEQLAAAGLDKLPLAPQSERVDLVAPPFSNPTEITNPLFPISNLHSAVLNGTVDDKAFRTETTLLPGTRIIEWPEGRPVETLVSQYVAYLDGRIEEVALDHYAQDDDGSVWYFGEDVFNYKDGVIADREGTWLAGRDGPAAMIMPANPQVGDVYFPENTPGFVFEQVRVKAVDQTVQGPRGPVEGAIVASELHQDGAREDKTFAPGYGEFFTGSGRRGRGAGARSADRQALRPRARRARDPRERVFDHGSEEASVAEPPGTPSAAAAQERDGRCARAPVRLRCRPDRPRPPASVPAAGRDRPRTVRPLGSPPDRRREGRQRHRRHRRSSRPRMDSRSNRAHARRRRPDSAQLPASRVAHKPE